MRFLCKTTVQIIGTLSTQKMQSYTVHCCRSWSAQAWKLHAWKCTPVPKQVPNLCTACVQACTLEMYTCLGTSCLGHVCISKQFPSLGTPNFTAVVVKVGDDMGQDSATEAIHFGLNQPLWFFPVHGSTHTNMYLER